MHIEIKFIVVKEFSARRFHATVMHMSSIVLVRIIWEGSKNEVAKAFWRIASCLEHYFLVVHNRPGNRYFPDCICSKQSQPTPDIMVWGDTISYNSHLLLVFVKEPLNSTMSRTLFNSFCFHYATGCRCAVPVA